MDSQMKQMGNNLHDRAAKPAPNKDKDNKNNSANKKPSPDDPDSKPR